MDGWTDASSLVDLNLDMHAGSQLSQEQQSANSLCCYP